MAQPRERLVGFIALAALAVILVPMLFDGQGAREAELRVRIPDEPPFPVMEVPTPRRSVLPDTSDSAPPRPARDEIRQPRMAVGAEVAAGDPEAEQPKGAVVTTAPQAETVDTPPPLSLEREIPVLDQHGVPVAWTLQLAAFKDRANAEGLRDRLIKSGYKAYIREKSTLSRVYIGPEVQRDELERLKAKLATELKLDGLILRFTTG